MNFLRAKKLTLLLLISFFVSNINAQNIDIDILKNINPDNPNSGYWKAVSTSGYVISAAVPIGLFTASLVKKDDSLKRKSLEVLGSVVVSVAVTQALKVIINRQRPSESYPGEIFPYKQLATNSFPSGHTSLAFGTAASLSIQFKKWYVTVPAYLWAANVAYSRMYLGVHYPSDVVAGAAVGIGSAYLSHWLNKKLFPTR